MQNIFIATSTFGMEDKTPLDYIASKTNITLNPYGRQLSTEEFVQFSKDCDGVIAGTEKITREALQQLPLLKVISRCGAGMDNVDLKATKEMNVKVFNTPDAPVDAVAELTIAFILSLLKKVTFMDKDLKSGLWQKRIGNLLKGKTVGIIGMGRIGSKVAKLLSAFDADIKYFDIEDKNVPYSKELSLSRLFEWSDIITLHCPASNNGKHLIGEKELALMKKTCLLINTSRGTLIDEEQLYNALKKRRIAGAALDVYRAEPYKGKLTELDNIILTPHVASSAAESRAEMEMEAAINLIKGLNHD